jgi:hypothetical protein
LTAAAAIARAHPGHDISCDGNRRRH